ncbi:hypothetical protein CLAFUW4_14517 [Fulvia fulva]|uniref:Acetyl-coenzyme A transferase nodX n=1 Tax=Passalora fulva TaxID=5499 RepID=A0A9Q8UWU9_PASFU|nr:Acetyl-coenzyme A transferase nodX [Fulvia fulva]KAK4609112.1 hypothetical protein CLAFUR4_14512 [Fulvia fulva]UJO25388.1 Acetyl-coenzyme A transferase nodX [Fulvia fulva]WPV22804.1 hypothetical protein CLAFUW4_14517 [Fulvia fulva]WPV37852.1 hypothetical protein CLAFUW7_14521 [Fulvia fulva]
MAETGGHELGRDLCPGSSVTARGIIQHIWSGLELPSHMLDALHLKGIGHLLPTSFRVADLAQALIALSALTASLVDATHNSSQTLRSVTVDRKLAVCEFASEQLYSLNGKPAPSGWGPLEGLHKTKDGSVRMHDSFPNHRTAALKLLGLPEGAAREDVAAKIATWNAIDLEAAAQENKAVMYALRSYDQRDATLQAQAVPSFPISIVKLNSSVPAGPPAHLPLDADRCLRGVRVLDLSRVIAAPVAGKTLAAHGANVLWVTSPHLPSLPELDVDVQRGKRTVQLDLDDPSDADKLRDLVKSADVFLQSYRPSPLAARDFSSAELMKLKPGVVVANLSAWGSEGPWKEARGFDSMVQTASGLNVSEALHCGDESSAKPLPLQALDHASGYLLATGIAAALYKRSREGGSWEVNVSLAGVGKFLRSLGQVDGKAGFEGDVRRPEELIQADMMEERKTGFGTLRAVRHSASIEGMMPGWDVMPKHLGSDEAVWL